jgi:hypothetical protein
MNGGRLHWCVLTLAFAVISCREGGVKQSHDADPVLSSTTKRQPERVTWEVMVDGEGKRLSAEELRAPRRLTDLVPERTRAYRDWRQFTLVNRASGARMVVSKPGADAHQKRPIVHLNADSQVVVSMVPQRLLQSWLRGGRKAHPRVKSFVDVARVLILTTEPLPQPLAQVTVKDLDGTERVVRLARVRPTRDPSKGRAKHGGTAYLLRDVIASGSRSEQPFRWLEIVGSKERYKLGRADLVDPEHMVLLKASKRRSIGFRHLKLPAQSPHASETDSKVKPPRRGPLKPLSERPQSIKRLAGVTTVTLIR